MSKPQWINPTRQQHLVRLFLDGMKCLYGHKLCPIPSHYAYTEWKKQSFAKPVKVRCVNTDGEPLKDSQGDYLYITVFDNITYSKRKTQYLRQYERDTSNQIKNWQGEDADNWQAERKILHSLHEKRLPARGKFSYISDVIWHESQPVYYLESIGMDCLRLKPFAKVKLSSSYEHLYVDLGESLRSLSKNKRHKVIRYHKPLPDKVQSQVNSLVMESVKHYLNH